jgi:hypothetical protein
MSDRKREHRLYIRPRMSSKRTTLSNCPFVSLPDW